MTPKEVRNEITKRYLTLLNQFPIAITGHAFDPPKDPAPWVRLTIIFNDGRQSSLGDIGNRKFIKSGFVNAQIFTPSGTGTDKNDEMAQDSLNLLDSIRIDQKLWMYNGKIQTIGDSGGYYQQNVVIEFNFEDIR